MNQSECVCSQTICRCGAAYRHWPTNEVEALIRTLEAERQSRFTLGGEVPESAYSEGVRLRKEGVSLSNLWGTVSERNIDDFDDVLRGYTGEAFVRVPESWGPPEPGPLVLPGLGLLSSLKLTHLFMKIRGLIK